MMAGLQDGVKYSCLQGNSSAKKTVIFVKLTDSALRAIEDYLHIQQKTRQHATLQFLGNEGRIHIPSSHANDGHSFEKFDFSLSSNVDIEGPQGSFECIQQCGSRALESMGTLPFKLRIHAKDDVYDLTRQRINFVEDKRKQDCAKEIKQPNADNGRKVKKKLGGGVHHLLLPHRREPSPISHYSNNSKPPSLLSTSKELSSKLTNGYSINNGSNYYGGNHQSNNHNYKHNGVNTHANGPSSKMVNMDITRRPLRERLIHMLALKPLKKPELMTKIYKDGIKDKEKKMLMMVLQQVSQLKDNVYNLSRGIWNDVHEDWPFYTEEERQIMKRRKPQNLTPPGSDCSVGSGTSSSSSPRSTTSGSGISPTSYPTTTTMSHNNYSSNNHLSNQYHNATQPIKSSSNYSSHNSNMNGSSSLIPGQLMPQQSQGVKRPDSFDSNNNSNNNSGSSGGGSGGNGGQQVNNDNIPSKKPRVSHFKRPNCSNGSTNSANNVRLESRDSPKNNRDSSKSPKSKDSPNSNKEMPPLQQQRSGNSHNSMGNGHNQDNRLSPTGNGLAPHINNHHNHKFLCDLQSDNILDNYYDSDYTTIRTLEQRNRYKAAFNAAYTEYRDVHTVIDKVSKKFAQLEERLRQEDKGSEGYQVVRNQIISEYNHNKNSKEYVDARRRFAQMHEKLSHIKQLVLEYDIAHSSHGSGGDPGCPDDF